MLKKPLKKLNGKLQAKHGDYRKPQFAEGQWFESISKLQQYVTNKYGFVSYSTLYNYMKIYGDNDIAIRQIKKMKGIE